MGAEFVIAPEAEQDVDEAYGWYEQRRTVLGEEFLDCVDACIHAICCMPEMHAKVFKDYRRALMRKFPYAIFYEYENGVVTVYCICHTSRSPEVWQKRLQ